MTTNSFYYFLQGDKVSPILNDGGTSRKFFRKGSDMSSLGADLAAVASTRFPGAAGKAFMTSVDTPGRSRKLGESTLETNFKRRQGSVNPSMPTIEFQSRQNDASKSRFMNRTIDALGPAGTSMTSAQMAISNQRILGHKDTSIQNLGIDHINI